MVLIEGYCTSACLLLYYIIVLCKPAKGRVTRKVALAVASLEIL